MSLTCHGLLCLTPTTYAGNFYLDFTSTRISFFPQWRRTSPRNLSTPISFNAPDILTRSEGIPFSFKNFSNCFSVVYPRCLLFRPLLCIGLISDDFTLVTIIHHRLRYFYIQSTNTFSVHTIVLTWTHRVSIFLWLTRTISATL